MNVTSYRPSEKLSAFVQHFLIIESEDEALLNRILPDTALVLAFRFKGEVSTLSTENSIQLSPITFSGIRKSAKIIHYKKQSANVLVIFKEAGASAFFEEPMHELLEEHISLDHFIGPARYSILIEQLFEATNDKGRIAVVENFLLSRLKSNASDPFILSVLQQIHATKGVVRIKELAGFHCLSQDAFEKRFRKSVGASPKLFSSIIRMKNLISNRKSFQTFTEMAYEAGFTDQAHFNKDFKFFTGLTPSDFYRNQPPW